MATAPDLVALDESALDEARRQPVWPADPLALWHLLSLDAPTVAIVWTWFTGRCFHAPTSARVLIAMFLAVWILYACDRLLDAMTAAKSSSDESHGLERRHLFHARYRRPFLIAIVCAIPALCWCIAGFAIPELVLYLFLGATLSLWLGLVHGLTAARSQRLPKELAVGLFFPVAVCVPALLRMHSARGQLLAPMMFFGLLCTTNGLFIRSWENTRVDSRTPRTDSLTRGMLARLPAISVACSLLPLLFVLLERNGFVLGRAIAIEFAVALSAAALMILHHYRGRIETTHLRALADLVLLSPLLLAPLLR